LSIRFNPSPAVGDEKQIRVWGVIREKFGDGAIFSKSDIKSLCEVVSPEYIKKLLTEWTGFGRLERFGFNKDTRYRLAVPLREEEPSSASEPGTKEIPS
jgi:hypothetical protein